MISPQEAVKAAVEFAERLLEPERRRNLQLEELERSTKDGREVWLVTLSMTRPASLPNIGNLAEALGMGPRDYKTFAVDVESGEVLAMRIREVTV